MGTCYMPPEGIVTAIWARGFADGSFAKRMKKACRNFFQAQRLSFVGLHRQFIPIPSLRWMNVDATSLRDTCECRL